MNLSIINNVLTIKNVFTAFRSMGQSGGGGSGQKPQNAQFKVFNPLISRHIKNVFSNLGIYKITFQVL